MTQKKQLNLEIQSLPLKGVANNEIQATFANSGECKELKYFGLDCPFCGSDHHCFGSQDLSFVMCRKTDVAPDGWMFTGVGKDGRNMLRREEKKAPRPIGTKEYTHTNNQCEPTIKVRIQYKEDTDKKDVKQYYWDGKHFVANYQVTKEQKSGLQGTTTWYRYPEIKKAIEEGREIFIVEGESVADVLWELGASATTAIGGAGKYRAYNPNLKADLNGASVILCPDRDTPGYKHMEDIYKDFPDAKWLLAPPSDFYWTHLPTSGGLDIKDWIESGATIENIMAAIQDRKIVVDALNKNLQSEGVGAEIARSGNKRLQNLILARWGERLRFNEMTIRPELDGKPLDMDLLSMQIAHEWDIDVSDEKAVKAVLWAAKTKSYHPVRDYLNLIADKYPDTEENRALLNSIASRYFGTTEPLHDIFAAKTMIGAVLRIFEPGEKHDTILTLQGGQGKLKSTFFEKLAVNKDWFDDSISSSNNSDKDERLKLRRFWMLELAEIEALFRKKEVASFRGFVTTKIDGLRVPYGRSVEAFPRMSIFVASVNPDEFLCDPEGHRRYWVVPVTVDRIPVEMLERECDLLWAAAVHAYRRGETNYLSSEQEKRNAFLNKRYEVTDSWQEIMEFHLQSQRETTVSRILLDCLKIDVGNHRRPEQMRVAEILKRMGWLKDDKKSKVDGSSVFIWRHPDSIKVATEIKGGSNQVATKVATNSNQDISSLSTDWLPPNVEKIENSPAIDFNIDATQKITPPGNLEGINNLKGGNQAETFVQQGTDVVATLVATLEKNASTVDVDLKPMTVMPVAESVDIEEVESVTPTVITPVTPPKFDAKANAEIMVACFAENNPGAMLNELCDAWTPEQKAEVKKHMAPAEINLVRKLMKEAKQVVQVEAPVKEPTAFKPGLKVKYIGDDAKLRADYENVELVVRSVVSRRQADCEVIKNGELVAYTSWFFLGVDKDKRELEIVEGQ